METITQDLAGQIADVAKLLKTEELPGQALHRLTGLAAELVPGASAAAVTIAAVHQPMTFAASDPRIGELHDLQFTNGEGPTVEVLRHYEPRRVDDTTAETRWPRFCRAAARADFASCLMLPLRTDRQPAGAIALYGQQPHAFTGAAHDIAMLFAAQGGTALHNAALYQECRQMIDNLHAALQSQAIIEQAKGILRAELDVSADEAFALLSRASQNTNRKVRLIAADLLQGQITPDSFTSATNIPNTGTPDPS